MVDIAQLVQAVNSALAGCPACGNGRVDGDETCDDGNTVGGDGCAANCTGEDRRIYAIAGGTCAGGPNDGASCQTKDECPGGFPPSSCASATVQAEPLALSLLLSGQEVLTTGRARASDPDATLPVVIKAADVHFDPVRLAGLECVCVRAVAVEAFGPGNAGVGEIGCGPAGLPDLDVSSSREHDISDVDPTCATGTLDPQSNACIGPLNITRSGGPGPRGSAVIRLSVGVEEIPDGGTCATETQTTVCEGGAQAGARCFGVCSDSACVPAKGLDGIPCTADDPVVATTATLYLTTGTARAEVLDANGIPGERIGVGEECPNGPCHAELHGAPFDCDALAANPGGGVDGASVVSAFPIIPVGRDRCLGDTVTTGVAPLLGLPKLSCPGG
jgi:cysteine-rich repeat protein